MWCVVRCAHDSQIGRFPRELDVTEMVERIEGGGEPVALAENDGLRDMKVNDSDETEKKEAAQPSAHRRRCPPVTHSCLFSAPMMIRSNVALTAL